MRTGRDLPKSSRIYWYSSFDQDLSRHEEIVQNHPLNAQIELIVPEETRSTRILLDQQLQELDMFYYQIQAPLVELLRPQALKNIVLNGKTYAIALNAPIDAANTVAILPPGILVLAVDTETYEQLGLEGTSTDHCLHRSASTGDRHEIVIDMTGKSFVPGKLFYDRVIMCLEQCLGDITMWICRSTDATETIQFPDSMASLRVDISPEVSEFEDITIPDLEHLAKSFPSQEVSQKVFDWVGLVSCRIHSLLERQDPDPFVSTYAPLQELDISTYTSALSWRWSGLIPDTSVKNALQVAQDFVDGERVPWVALTVWGFDDAPCSWKRGETLIGTHGNIVDGSNNYTIICLPKKTYWLMQSIGPHDESK